MSLTFGYPRRVLPDVIFHMTMLRKLDLNFIRMTALPPEIGQLTNLEVYAACDCCSTLALFRSPSRRSDTSTSRNNDQDSTPRDYPAGKTHRPRFEPEQPDYRYPVHTLSVCSIQMSQTNALFCSVPEEVLELVNLRTLEIMYNHLQTLPNAIGNKLCRLKVGSCRPSIPPLARAFLPAPNAEPGRQPQQID